MPMRVKAATAAKTALPRIPAELLDQFVTGPMTQDGIEEVMRGFKKAVIGLALGAEMSHHLGYAPGADKPAQATNQRNGKSSKTVLTGDAALRIDIPRDRSGLFEPQIIGKYERRFTGFDDKIIAMYARGMSVREIQGFLSEMYAVDVSPEFISSITDAMRVKTHDEAVVRSKDILGIWIENTEGAKFWMKVFNDLKTRGCNGILIAVTDGLKGMGEALAVVYQRFPTVVAAWRRVWDEVILANHVIGVGSSPD